MAALQRQEVQLPGECLRYARVVLVNAGLVISASHTRPLVGGYCRRWRSMLRETVLPIT